jgi:hypothetical protein
MPDWHEIELFPRDRPHHYPEVEAMSLTHAYRLSD